MRYCFFDAFVNCEQSYFVLFFTVEQNVYCIYEIKQSKSFGACFIIHNVLHIYSLAPGRFEGNFVYVTFKLILVIDAWSISCEITLW